jgi:hypothetical protein
LDRIRDGYEPEKIMLFGSLAWRAETLASGRTLTGF